MLLFGHVDVVKPGDKWTKDPFGAVLENGKIYGRGAVDMKGGLAAMIMAVEAVLRSGAKPAGDILVGTVVDEEAGGMGVLDFVHRGYRADACILTESTGLSIAPLCRGILWGKLVVNFRFRSDIDSASRLIQNEEPGRIEQPPRQHHLLLTAPAQADDQVVHVRGLDAGMSITA